MKTKGRKVIYRGPWPGLGELYNIKVETGYTTIVVKPGEHLKERTKETREKFVRKDIALPLRPEAVDRPPQCPPTGTTSTKPISPDSVSKHQLMS